MTSFDLDITQIVILVHLTDNSQVTYTWILIVSFLYRSYILRFLVTIHRICRGRYLEMHCSSGLMCLRWLSVKLTVLVKLTSKSGKLKRLWLLFEPPTRIRYLCLANINLTWMVRWALHAQEILTSDAHDFVCNSFIISGIKKNLKIYIYNLVKFYFNFIRSSTDKGRVLHLISILLIPF